MNILGVGAAELVVILVIMLVVAGPKRMVRWAYTLGQWTAQLRRMWDEVVTAVQKEIDQAGLDVEVPKEMPTRQSLNRMARSALKPLAEPVEETIKEVRQTSEQMKQAGTQAQGTVRDAWAQAARPAQNGKPPADPTPPPSGFGTWGGAPPPADPAPPPTPSTPDDAPHG